MNNIETSFHNHRRPAATRARGYFLSALAVLSLVACGGVRPASVNASDVQPAPAATAAAPQQQNSYAPVVSRVAPAVVTVRSERRGRAAQQFPFMDDPRFRDFFGDRLPRGEQQEPPQRRERGMGSGVVVRADGYILTNHHVVDGAEEITVELNDRRSFTAKLVGSDPPSDLAVLKVEASALPVLALGDSDRVEVGDVVLAVGNPLGIGQTVTSGIVSAKSRATGLSDGSFEDFIQTDAAINRGNSGGALVNTSGELIGINSQILSPSGGNIGIGFSIPSNMAKNVMEQIIQTGKVRRGLLGVTIQAVTPDIAASLGLSTARGALVSGVTPGGPAERAGVRRGDVITALNGQPVNDSNALRNRVAATQPGAEVTFTVLRDNREQQLRATLGELPVQTSSANDTEEGGARPGATAEGSRLGVGVEPLTPEAATRLKLPRDTQGLLVGTVDPAGPAAEAGVRRNDVIQEVNRQPVRTVEELRAALDRTGNRPALLLVTNEGGSGYVTVRLRR
ncbi:MAG TPA: DegQ family serine endoprotease [Pyrinomonadaceae bacterium]